MFCFRQQQKADRIGFPSSCRGCSIFLPIFLFLAGVSPSTTTTTAAFVLPAATLSRNRTTRQISSTFGNNFEQAINENKSKDNNNNNNYNVNNGSVAHIRAVGGPRADVYGEMTAYGFLQMCAVLASRRKSTDIFLDLGSGHGALVFQAVSSGLFSYAMGIELSSQRHDQALQALAKAPLDMQAKVTLLQGDAAGDLARSTLLTRANVVWCSNLLFETELLERLARVLAESPTVHTIVSLKEFPNGIAGGFTLQPHRVPLDMSWTQAGKQQPGHPPLLGHPCCVYTRTVLSSSLPKG